MAPETSQHLSVTTILAYCKSKILNPYLRLLSITGLKSLITEHEPSAAVQFINFGYTLQVVLFLMLGYVLQYMSCFRRDRGFCYKPKESIYMIDSRFRQAIHEQICHGPLVFSFVIPSCLHLFGYLHAVTVMRHSDDDKLQVLMERVFLLSTNLSDGFTSQKRLIRTLWLFVVVSIVWMVLSLGTVSCMMVGGSISFKWLEDSPAGLLTAAKTLLVVATLWHDLVQATIISNYCLQVCLLTSYIQLQRDRLLQCPVHALEWMREMEEFKRMLAYVNNDIAPSVGTFTIMNLACGLSGLFWLLNYDQVDKETTPIRVVSVVNVGLWLFLAAAPFLQAARLSSSFELLRSVGQEVRVRPFVHQDTPGTELDSILLYTLSLKLRAKLLWIPITTRYLCLFLAVILIIVLVLGQSHYLNVDI